MIINLLVKFILKCSEPLFAALFHFTQRYRRLGYALNIKYGNLS